MYTKIMIGICILVLLVGCKPTYSIKELDNECYVLTSEDVFVDEITDINLMEFFEENGAYVYRVDGSGLFFCVEEDIDVFMNEMNMKYIISTSTV